MRRPFSSSKAWIAAAAIALVPAGCERPAEETPDAGAATVTEAEHRERAEEAYDDYAAALLAGDAQAAASLYSEDAWIRGEGSFASVRGRSEFGSVLEEGLSGATFESVDVEIEDVIVLGDHAYESGTYSESLRIGDAAEPMRIQGGYAALWRQEDAGVWRIYRFIWNEQPSED